MGRVGKVFREHPQRCALADADLKNPLRLEFDGTEEELIDIGIAVAFRSFVCLVVVGQPGQLAGVNGPIGSLF